MKVHRVLVEKIVRALDEIFFENQRADKVIEKYMKSHRNWGSRDRRFFAENVYECVRWWRMYWAMLGIAPVKNRLLDLWAVHWAISTDFPMPDFPELKNLSREKLRSKDLTPAEKNSVSDWFYNWGAEERGDWDRVVEDLNQIASVDLRVNALKTTPVKALQALESEDIFAELISGVPYSITLNERKNVFSTKAFQDGFFEVQDRNSQKIVPLLDVEPGQRVVDACAGAGGKTLQLSSVMQNKGKILALDIYPHKLEELQRRAKRAGSQQIETRLIDTTKVIKRLHETADRVLLDVPCTGVGVLRRNPDKKWKLEPADLERLLLLQREILSSYSQMLKPKGLMVYATCSIMPSENQKQVQWFLEKNKNWQIVEEREFLPGSSGGEGDGFYACSLRKG